MRFRLLTFCCSSLMMLAVSIVAAQKTVTIHVNEKSELTIDGVSVYSDNLAKEIQQRLWRSYMSNGKMLQSIVFRMDQGVPDGTKTMVLDAIKTAQSKTLTVLSLHKHKKRFEESFTLTR